MPLGSDNGAMEVVIAGIDHNNQPKTVKWSLYAPKGIGPYIPTLSTIIVTRKLLRDNKDDHQMKQGATACVGLLTLADFAPYFQALGIYAKVDISGE